MARQQQTSKNVTTTNKQQQLTNNKQNNSKQQPTTITTTTTNSHQQRKSARARIARSMHVGREDPTKYHRRSSRAPDPDRARHLQPFQRPSLLCEQCEQQQDEQAIRLAPCRRVCLRQPTHLCWLPLCTLTR
ncbi:hypothetical protein PTSG_13174 [Salpingoeca rosetta]|uniref:Uncharacterized protein n=1 Tax=Salpingoeca rosetta (strain ATCC 50818 / BSB-021) TaxID=946362 RepID=F2UT59_SALR5|nr:uncharacterized protein PTSG_13174 [Salpingoeca rosetta]EGD81318.1 hypothetical protein PTSG_13174 [Salpingoeca rosetta]|eukprot:XP_004987714.1 hypothetical protein PTSG_13174 [Salpingoeca rosetta]